MTYRAWICATCNRPGPFRDDIWDCPGCGKETCEHCFDRYAHCKKCSKGKTDVELITAANEKEWDFDLPEGYGHGV